MIPVLLLLVVLPAHADVVVLKNGSTIEGIATESGDWVVIKLDFGTVKLARSEVARIVKAESPLQELQRRRKELKDGDAEARYELAGWADQQELYTSARNLHREVVELSPDHEGARRALGYRKHDGKWLTEEEYYVAGGYVKYDGRWVPREVAAALESEAERARLERLRAEAAERIRAMDAEVELARIAAERELRELELHYRSTFVFYPHYHYIGTVTYPCGCSTPNPFQKK